MTSDNEGGMTILQDKKYFQERARELLTKLEEHNLVKMQAVDFSGQARNCFAVKRDPLPKDIEFRAIVSESNHRCQLVYIEGGSLNVIVISLWHQNSFDFRNRVYNNERVLNYMEKDEFPIFR